MLKLQTGSLQTPRKLHLMNRSDHPRLFVSDDCPLCGMSRADEFHVLCECPCLDPHRREALVVAQEMVAKRLRRPGGEFCSPPLVPSLRAWIHPTQRADFLWGYVPIAARDWAASRHYDLTDTSSLCSALYAAIATVHDSVWKCWI